MYPIIFNSENKEHGFQTFYEKFVEICLEHKEQGRALMFAFILYDFESPQIAKILKDEEYWTNLNSLSGKYLTVFSIHHKEKVRYRRKPSAESKTINMMVNITDYKNPAESSTDLIEKYFGGIDIVFPSVLFFQLAENKVIDYSLIELNEEKIEPAFYELKKYIEEAVNTLKKITEENKDNNKEIFDLVKLSVDGVNTKNIVLNRVKQGTALVVFFKSVFGLSKLLGYQI